MALRDLAQTLTRVLRNASPVSFPGAAPPPPDEQEPFFPGLLPHYWGSAWPPDALEYDYPKAAALVAVVYSCVTRIGDDFGCLPMTLHLGEGSEQEELSQEHPLARLWAKPNPEQSGLELRRDMASSLMASGNAYIYGWWGALDPESGAPPQRLYAIPGHLLRPVPGPNLSVRAYWYEAASKMLPANRVFHVRLWNPNHDPLLPAPVGLSPLSAARMDWEARYHLGKWQRGMFKRGGAINHLFASREEGFDEQDAKAMTKRLRELVGKSSDEAWKPTVIPNLEILQAGVTPRDMMFLEMAQLTDVGVCNIYKMPPLMVGIRSAGLGSQAGAETDFLLYDTGALGPVAALFEAVLNAQFFDRFAPGVRCSISIKGRYAVQRAQLQQAKGVFEATGRYPLTLNEGRKRMGDPPAPDDAKGDAFFVPYSLATVDSLSDPEAGAEPGGGPAPGGGEPEDDDEDQLEEARRVRLSRAKRRAYYRRSLRRYELRVARWHRGRMRRQLGEVVEAVSGDPALAGFAAGTFVREASLAAARDFRLTATEAELEQAQRIFDDLIADRGAEAAAEVGSEVALEVQRGHLRSLVDRRVRSAVTQIDGTTERALRAALLDFMENVPEGAKLEDLIERLTDVFGGRAAKAEVVARTETAWAYNTASFEAWGQSDVRWKSWQSLNDGAVRESHQDAQEEGVIAFEALFGNGCAYPGDPAGGPEETCNCRCVLMPELSASGDASGEDEDEEQELVVRDLLRPRLDARRNGHAEVDLDELVEALR